MSFSKSRRFPYSELPLRSILEKTRSPNDSRATRIVVEEKSQNLTINPKYIKDSLESLESKDTSRSGIRLKKRIQRKESTEVVNTKKTLQSDVTRENPLNQFLIPEENVRTKCRNPIKKIATGVKRYLSNSLFAQNVYNVRKEEEKQRKNSKNERDSTVTYEHFTSELAELKHSQHKFKKITSDQKYDHEKKSVEADTDETLNKIDEIIVHTNSKIHKLLQESLLKIKENSNRTFKCFLAEMIAYSVFALEEVQHQCENTIRDMNIKIGDILKKKSEQFSMRERELSARLQEAKFSAKNLEKKYIGLLKASEKQIALQELLIETLRAEIDAVELSCSLERVFQKEKRK